MEILLYSRNSDSDEQRLLKMIKYSTIEICRSTNRLRERLNISAKLRRIVILLIQNKNEIDRISEWIMLISDPLVVMILQNDDPSVLKAAHRIRPRYISFRDRDYQDVIAVLSRMQERHGIQEPSSMINTY
jgi:hypothetical protein